VPQSSKAQVINVSRAGSAALDKTMRANKHKLETLAGTKGASVQIESTPSKATVFVDHLAVSYAPATVRLAAGKHIVELQSPAYLPWRQELSVTGGETIHLEPQLVRDKTQVLVSFDK
jgi:hypothetical protein